MAWPSARLCSVVRGQRREPQPAAGAAVVRRSVDRRVDAHRRALRRRVPRRRADGGRRRRVPAHAPGGGPVAGRHRARRPLPPRSSAALDVRRARRLRSPAARRRSASTGRRRSPTRFAAVATIAFVVYRPAHSALLPSLCLTPLELTSANVVRGLVDSLSTLIGPALAAVLLAVADPATALGAARPCSRSPPGSR